MSNKSFQSWVPRSTVETTMGVERGAGTRSGEAFVDAVPGRQYYTGLPVDVFNDGGSFIGLAFDGEMFLEWEMRDQIKALTRGVSERDDLFATAVFAADRTLAGYHITAERLSKE